MPHLVSRPDDTTPPRFDLLPGEETCNYEDGTFIPHLPGMKVGDPVLIESNVRVSRIVAEDERGHMVEFDHELAWTWVD